MTITPIDLFVLGVGCGIALYFKAKDKHSEKNLQEI